MEQEGDYLARWAAIRAIAKKIRCNRETLRRWTPQTQGIERLGRAKRVTGSKN